ATAATLRRTPARAPGAGRWSSPAAWRAVGRPERSAPKVLELLGPAPRPANPHPLPPASQPNFPRRLRAPGPGAGRAGNKSARRGQLPGGRRGPARGLTRDKLTPTVTDAIGGPNESPGSVEVDNSSRDRLRGIARVTLDSHGRQRRQQYLAGK